MNTGGTVMEETVKKSEFEKAVIEVVEFETEDVITTSDFQFDGGNEN